MKDERPERLRSICDELLRIESKDFWEVIDRGTNFDYVDDARKAQLKVFFSWFPSLTKGDSKCVEALLSVVLLAAAVAAAAARSITSTTTRSPRSSVQEKQGILAAQQEKEVAKTEQQKAEADLKNIDNELSVAENDYKAAKLQLDTAKLNVKSGRAVGRRHPQGQSTHDVKIAELGVKASDAKVDWLNKKRKWIKAQRDAADDHFAAADSRLELEKAKLAQQKGIKPSDDFNVMNFETDNLKKQQALLGVAHGRRQDAGRRRALERDWHAQLSTYDRPKPRTDHGRGRSRRTTGRSSVKFDGEQNMRDVDYFIGQMNAVQARKEPYASISLMRKYSTERSQVQKVAEWMKATAIDGSTASARHRQ